MVLYVIRLFLLAALLIFFSSRHRHIYIPSAIRKRRGVRRFICRYKTISRFIYDALYSLSYLMRRSLNARKLYIFLLVIALILVQAMDYFMALNIAERYGRDALKTTIPYHIMLVTTLVLFKYSMADRILLFIGRRKAVYLIFALLILLTLVFSPRLIVVTDCCSLILLFALYYPPFSTDNEPKGRRPLPIIEDIYSGRMAA